MNALCPICGNNNFSFNSILWEELISQWELFQYETDYINKQQGMICTKCNSNLRSLSLAQAIMDNFNFVGLFKDFVCNKLYQDISILEINNAGHLSVYFQELLYHKLVSYPEYDIMNLSIADNTYDIVLHSDTLEHVNDPIVALKECKRVLKKNGKCLYTVPFLVDKLTRNRSGMQKSYHGNPDTDKDDMLVYNEFGCDVWKYGIIAGFKRCSLFCYDYPASIVIELSN